MPKPRRPKSDATWQVLRGPTVDKILPKLVRHLTQIDASSGYHNMKLNERSSYSTTFACQFGRFRYARLSFDAVPARDMFQRIIDKIFKELL